MRLASAHSAPGDDSIHTTVRRRLFAGAAALTTVIGAVLVPTAAFGAGPLSVTGTKVSSSTLPPDGGTLTVSATPSVTSTCSVVVNPTQPDVPAGASCHAGVAYSTKVPFSANTSTSVRAFSVEVKACANGSCTTSPPVTVTQWAYKLTFTSTSAPWGTPTSISCPTSAFCAATDGTSYVYFQQRKVYRRVLLQQGRLLLDVACSSPTLCIAGDLNGDGFVWNGKSWKRSITGTSAVSYSAVHTSASPGGILAVLYVRKSGAGFQNSAYRDFKTDDRGPFTFTTPGLVSAVSCPDGATTCNAVDSMGYFTTFAGTTAASSELLYAPAGPTTPNELTTLSCPSSTDCITGGSAGVIFRRQRRIKETKGETALSSKSTVTGLSCANDSFCFVGSSSGSTTFAIADGDVNNDGIPDVVFTSLAKDPVTPLVISAVPGPTTALPVLIAAGKSKDMTGHVTLLK